MKTLTKFFLVVIALSVCSIPLFAQISEGGLPPSFQYEKKSSLRVSASNEAHIILPINFDVKQLIAEDKEAEAAGEAINCAKIIPVDLTMENSGVWSTLSNGQEVWQLTIEAPKAIALLLYYSDFYIPGGGKLFIYNKEKNQVLGAYNHTTNAAGRGFATEFVAGDVLTLEYVAPAGEASGNLPRIRIEGVSYGYNHLNVYSREKEGEEAATYACYVNVICSPEGDDWQNESKGVVRAFFRKTTGSTGMCSASMINNTKGDFAPYLLTAFHCVRETDAASLDQSVFYYNYESASCSSNTAPATTQTITGAQAKVSTGDGYSDGSLLLLNSNVPETYGPYFNGWDVTGEIVTGTIGIHHPGGDVKKISYSKDVDVYSTTWSGDVVSGTHWRVPRYTETPNGKSIVEGGSSGSPLFSQNEHLIIGHLHGGNTVEDCDKFTTRASSYGKLWFDWDQMPNPDLHMKTYLDPENTGTLKLAGSAYTSTGTYTVTFSVTDEADDTPITNARITFNNVTNAAGDYTFTGITGPRLYHYTVYKTGYTVATGSFSVLDNTTETVSLTSLGYEGVGTEEEPFLISNKEELMMLHDFLGTGNKDVFFQLTADINMSGSNWEPIGTYASPFCAHLKGKGHKLTNLQITETTPASGTAYYGLFGVIGSGAHIDSLHIVSGKIEIGSGAGSAHAGSIAGSVNGTTTDAIVISYCSNSVNITNNAQGTANYTGGIIGGGATAASALTISYCANTGDIYGSVARAGGIIGNLAVTHASGSLLISNCYSDAVIISTRPSTEGLLGGIIGCPYQNNATYGPLTITQCYATGRLETNMANIAGRLGGISGRIYDSVSAAYPITISQSVAAQESLDGNVASATAHRIYPSHTTNGVTNLSDVYAYVNMLVKGAVETGGSATSSRGLDKTLAELNAQATYSGINWDFTNAWAIREDISFPYFQYQSAPVGITSLYALNTTLNTLTESGNIDVYKGNKKVYLSTLTVTAAGDNTYLLSEVAVGDTLFFVNTEPGKAPSYPVQGIVTSLGTIAVTFEVVDVDEIPITDAVVTLNGVTNPSGNYAFTGLSAGTYAYTVSKAGYITQTGSITVSDRNITKEIVLELKTTFDVTFVIKDVSNTPITDAVVTFNGVTNPVGDYTFTNNPNGTYSYTVTKTGYKTATGNVTVSGEDITKNVTMELTYIVAFSVVDIFNEPVSDAVITLDGVNNPSGNYLFVNVANGTHSFSVTRPGYLTVYGSITVNNGNQTRNIVLQPTGYTPTYTVTFVVRNISNTAIDNATIWLNGSNNIAGDYVFTGLGNGDYEYVIGKGGYLDSYGTVTVNGSDIVQHVILIANSYNVIFAVKDVDNHTIDNAVITFNGIANIPGDYGFYNINPGSYTYSVVAPDYKTVTGILTVESNNVSELLVMQKSTYNVSFTVVDEQNIPINDARIIFGTTINPSGNYTFSNIAKGEYEYTIIREGYYSAMGSITVTNANVYETCFLKSPKTGIDAIGGSVIVNLYPNPASDILNVKVNESLVPVSVDILSISGERYFTQTYNTASFTLDISRYPAGLLLVKVSTKDSSIVKTIVKKAK
ncbi:MAG: carboxypeptidase regulatory-like domain-containing protein [Dysgonamonadaceae bacterium]|jgi:hypothetical protein|nr:carboxypeptidase regulatory-like domain-containing protein [Dysgonamonadaceae bacterium]